MRYSQLLSSLQHGHEGRAEVTIPENWMQGRTTYGGLTATLALESARQLAPEHRVRSAQIAFIGPVGGEIVISPKVLRAGRNTVIVNVDLVTETGIGARCLFVFGAPRESAVHYRGLPMPNTRPLPDAINLPHSPATPSFITNFDLKLGCGTPPLAGADRGEVGLWIRHKDPDASRDTTTLLSIGDAPWPAVLGMLTKPAPGSSMTWMAEFLGEAAQQSSDWYFAHSIVDMAHNGYSSQAMTLWNEAGDPVLVGRQTVAVFG